MHALSPTDSAFLWMETRNQPMHVAGLNIYTPPDGDPHAFVTRLMAHWSREVQAHRPFNLRPVLRMGLWYWEEDQEFELDYHLRHVALPQPGRIRELLALVSRVHGNLMDRNRPLWEAYVIEGLPGGRIATYTKIHHALIDGVTGAKLLAESLSTDPQQVRPPLWSMRFEKHPAARAPAKVPGLVQQIANAVRNGRDILPGVTSGLWDMLRGGDEGTAFPFQAPPSPFNVEISGSRRFAAQSYSLDRIQRIGRAHGATVNDVTLAICAGALRKYLQMQKALPRKPLIAMVPVSLHDQTDAGGNQVSLLLANLGTHLADPLRRLQHIVQSTAQAKARLAKMPRLQKMAHGITSISPMGPGMVTGTAEKHPLFNVVISNVPGPRETLYLNGARLDEVYPLSIVTHYLALNITISGYADRMGFGFIACRRSVPSLQRMLDFTDASIAELEASMPQAAPHKPKASAKSAVKASAKAPRKVAVKSPGKAPAKAPAKAPVKAAVTAAKTAAANPASKAAGAAPPARTPRRRVR